MSAIFTYPSWQRLVVAMAYAVAVAAAVGVVEAPLAAAVPVPATSAATGRVLVRAEATFPVGRWTVLVDGLAVEGVSAAQVWTGSACGHEVLVQAERLDAADQSPGALRLEVGAQRSLAWGEGTVSATAAIP